MSAQAVSAFLRRTMLRQGLNNSQVASRAGISRQTWYNLLNADIKEAKLSTIMNVAKALDVSPNVLTDIYFSRTESTITSLSQLKH